MLHGFGSWPEIDSSPCAAVVTIRADAYRAPADIARPALRTNPNQAAYRIFCRRFYRLSHHSLHSISAGIALDAFRNGAKRGPIVGKMRRGQSTANRRAIGSRKRLRAQQLDELDRPSIPPNAAIKWIGRSWGKANRHIWRRISLGHHSLHSISALGWNLSAAFCGWWGK